MISSFKYLMKQLQLILFKLSMRWNCISILHLWKNIVIVFPSVYQFFANFIKLDRQNCRKTYKRMKKCSNWSDDDPNRYRLFIYLNNDSINLPMMLWDTWNLLCSNIATFLQCHLILSFLLTYLLLPKSWCVIGISRI